MKIIKGFNVPKRHGTAGHIFRLGNFYSILLSLDDIIEGLDELQLAAKKIVPPGIT